MKKYLFLLLAAIFCLPIMANAQKGIRYDTGPYIAGEAAAKQRMERHQTKSINKNNKSYNDYVKRLEISAHQQNQAYLNAKVAVECVTDEATGTSTIKWSDGSAYQGQTYYGEIKGIGTMIYPDKSKYVGSWERDLPNGQGTFQTPEGITFTTTFVNGVPHGKGVIQDLDGRMYSARWVRGVLKEKSIKPLEE